jgi:hypothetical protein
MVELQTLDVHQQIQFKLISRFQWNILRLNLLQWDNTLYRARIMISLIGFYGIPSFTDPPKPAPAF